MSYLFFFDTIQFRNFIAQFIILFATRYLFDKSGISTVKYIFCIAIAGSMHTLSWLYLSLLLIKFVRTKIGYQRIFGIATFIFILCILLQPVLPKIVDILSNILKRGSGYLNGTLRFNYLVVMVLHLLGFAPLYLYRNKIANEEAKAKIILVMKAEIIVGLFLPLCFFNSNFNRVFRNILILDTIGLTLLYENLKKNTESNDVTLAAQLLLVVGWLGTDLYRNREGNIIDAIFKYNLIYNHIELSDIWQYFIVIIICLSIILAFKKILSLQRDHKKKEIKCA